MFMGWGGFLNIFQTTWSEDLEVKMMEDEWGKAKIQQGFPYQVVERAPKYPSKRIDLFIPTTMGCVAWLGSVHKNTFKNLQHLKKSCLPTKLCNNI